MHDWLEALPEEECERLVDSIAKAIVGRGMATPALIFLEMHRPLGNVAGHGLMITSPFVAPFVGMDNLQGFTRLIRKPEDVEKLMKRIETLADARKPKKQPTATS